MTMHSNATNIKKLFSNIKSQFHEHPTIKFFIVMVIIIAYLILSIHKFGGREGLLVSALTWSFFVLCTPIADAGILIDLPVRIFTGIKMIYSEIAVWVLAITLNVTMMLTNTGIYEDTIILSLFHHILIQPMPYYIIIILSGVGTFLSLLFGDEIIDISYKQKEEREHHKKFKQKRHLIILISLFVLILIIYDLLLNKLGVNIPLF